MGKLKTKSLRGSKGYRAKDNYDLMVPIPKTACGVSSLECKILVKEMIDRLSSTGFTYLALTHIIYGRPKPEDKASVAIPSYLWASSSEKTNENKNSKKRTLQESSEIDQGEKKRIRILRRLHVILENVSDMGFYLSNGPQEQLLNEYDIISICPTNELTFQSTCSSATMADIITLDYTARGLRLPYRIRSIDVKAAIERGATFEIPIAPALIHLKQRKALVCACQELKNNSLGLKPPIIVSSGDRTLDGTDVGALALRMPGDISNLCKAVMHFDGSTASCAIGLTASRALQRGRDRRSRPRNIKVVASSIQKADLLISDHSYEKKNRDFSAEWKNSDKADDTPQASDDVDDGFIAF